MKNIIIGFPSPRFSVQNVFYNVLCGGGGGGKKLNKNRLTKVLDSSLDVDFLGRKIDWKYRHLHPINII